MVDGRRCWDRKCWKGARDGDAFKINIGTCWDRCEKNRWEIDGRCGLDGGTMEARLGI